MNRPGSKRPSWLFDGHICSSQHSWNWNTKGKIEKFRELILTGSCHPCRSTGWPSIPSWPRSTSTRQHSWRTCRSGTEVFHIVCGIKSFQEKFTQARNIVQFPPVIGRRSSVPQNLLKRSSSFRQRTTSIHTSWLKRNHTAPCGRWTLQLQLSSLRRSARKMINE